MRPALDGPARWYTAIAPLLRWAAVLLLCSALPFTSSAVQAQEAASPSAAVRPPLAPCILPSPMGEFDALCVRVPVPEDPARPEGRIIELNVVVLPALEPRPGAVPLFELAGGPGIGVTAAAGIYAGPLLEYRRHRPVVLVDRRGTGESHPLRCAALESADPLGPIYPLEAVRACRDGLAGYADLDRYGSEIAAGDLDHVRELLGYDRVDLWGLSYGAALAQVYLRRFPDRVRSAVLVGVPRLDAREPLHRAAGTQRVLDLLFDACEADPSCSHAFPDLRDEWRALLQRLGAGPIRVVRSDPETGEAHGVELRRGPFAEELGGLLGTASGQAAIPFIIHRAAAGDFEPFLARLRRGPSPFAEGLYLSVACPQWTSRIGPEQIRPLTEDTFLGDYRVREWQGACAEWPTAPAHPSLFEPPTADVPVLVLSGEMDHATPPHFGAELCASLPRCRSVVIPRLGHQPFDLDAWRNGECFDRLAIEFFTDPDPAALDVSCVATMVPPPFVLASAPHPEADQTAGLTSPDQQEKAMHAPTILASTGITVDGVELHYVERGSGTPVVLVHGSLADYTYWEWSDQIPLLAEHHRVIAYSRRYNHPNRNPRGTDHSPMVEARDLAGFLDRLGTGPVHLVGHSYGAYTALVYAMEHPERVRSLVLAEPPIISWLPDIPGGEGIFEGFMPGVWEPQAEAFRSGGDAAGLDFAARFFFQLPFAEIEPEWQTLFSRNAEEWHALAVSDHTFPKLDYERVRALAVPTLLLSAGQNAGGFNDLVDGHLARLLPNVERVIIPDVSHEMFLDDRAASASAMLGFFRRH